MSFDINDQKNIGGKGIQGGFPANLESLRFNSVTNLWEFVTVVFDGLHTSLADKEVVGVIDHADLSVTTAKIALLAVTEALLAAQAVSLAKMKNEAGNANLFIGYDGAGNIVAKTVGAGLGDLEFLRDKQLSGDLVISTAIRSGATGTLATTTPAVGKTFFLAHSSVTMRGDPGGVENVTIELQNNAVIKEIFIGGIQALGSSTGTALVGSVSGDSLVGDGAKIYRLEITTMNPNDDAAGTILGWIQDT